MYMAPFWQCILSLVFSVFFVTSGLLVGAETTTMKYIKKYGYPAETHRVITADGYILTVERIPNLNRGNATKFKSPLILLHGMISNAMQFLVAGPENGLGFICSDAGFDVWLINFRGNQFSSEHMNQTRSKQKYWDFSFYETGVHDTLATVDYVLLQTRKPKVHVLGYSMGASAALIGLAERPSYNDKVQSLVLMAPTTSMRHASTPLRYIAPYVDFIQYMLKEMNFHFIPFVDLNLFKVFNRRLCSIPALGERLCRQFLYTFQGIPFPINSSILLPIFESYPDYTSSKTVIHYFQHLRTGNYCSFDYGSKKNEQIYNATVPPAFDLSQVTTKIMVICSQKDAFSDLSDNMWLKSRLPKEPTIYQVRTPEVFGHLSFTLDAKVNPLVYKHILNFLQSS